MQTNEIEFQISMEVDENKAATRATLDELESSLRKNKNVKSVEYIEKETERGRGKGADLSLAVVVLPSLLTGFFLLLNTKIQTDRHNPIKIGIESSGIKINIEYDRGKMTKQELETAFIDALEKFEAARIQTSKHSDSVNDNPDV